MSFQIQYTYNLIDKISPSLKRIQHNVDSTTRQITRSTSKAAIAFKKMGHSIDTVGRKARDLGKSLFLKTTLPITLMGASFVKAASDAEETSSKFAVVFKDVGSQAEKAAQSVAKGFGLSSIKAKELLSDTGDLLTGFGFTGGMALDLSKRVNELAVDLASFTNFSGGAEGASKALTKALLGERESVKSLGISILENDVKAKIKALIPTGKLRGMTERQAKAYATLQIAIEQSKNAIGDYSRTSAGFANRTRVLSERFLDLKIKLGTLLLPLALKLVNVTIKLINKFNELSPTTQKIILTVAGLVAVVAPLLMLIGGAILVFKGLMLVVLALIPVLKVLFTLFLANPIGLIITAIGLLIAGVVILSKKLKNLGFSLADIPRLALDSFQRTFPKVFKFFDFLAEKIKMIYDFYVNTFKVAIDGIMKAFNFAKDFVGLGDQKIEKNITSQSYVNMAQAKQSVNVDGSVGIDIRGLPKGSNAGYTPMPNNNINMGINSIFAQ